MELASQLVCQCNNKTYKSLATLKSHQKSQGHLFWEQHREQRELSIKLNRLENENDHLRRLNILLMERLKKLEN
jgi:hypothetical protein